MANATRFILRFSRIWLLLLGLCLAGVLSQLQHPTVAQDQSAKTPKPKKAAQPQGEALPLIQVWERRQVGQHLDFPMVTSGPSGMMVASLQHDGASDQLRLDQLSSDGELLAVGDDLAKGVLHQPAIAVDREGGVWTFWGELGDDAVMELQGRSPEGETFSVASSVASESFADAGTDSEGRIWVVWQSLRHGNADIFARYFEGGVASAEIPVATTAAGEWEPQIAFDHAGQAWVVFDSAEGNEFNVQLARVEPNGTVKIWPIAPTERYEARADLALDADGTGFWIAAERGRVRWGLDVRGHGNEKGLNAQTEVLFGRFDVASETFTEHPLGPAGEFGNPVNLPTVGVDAKGRPWVAYRYFERVLWRIAVTRFDPETQTWTSRRRIPGSSFGQDRRSTWVRGDGDQMFLGWASDLRKTKKAEQAGVYLAAIDSNLELPPASPPTRVADLTGEPFSPSQRTPERAADDRHTWEIEGKSYGLYWGDLHRHTDVSNCRTGFDGCIAEHFRYAYDIGKLNFMGTSDHTDIGKIYDPYEWWHNQRMHDAFHAPGQFNSLYVYEREQKWPWGHRNIVFADRGGPIVYINRTFYRNSPWQEAFPVKPGVNEIHPTELWQILEQYGKSVASISHTGATSMGTDWGAYEEPIDIPAETILEIFQGARVSYEGIGAPQPTVGLRPGEKYTVASGRNEPHKDPPAPITDFGKYNPGVYQNALKLGHRLGVFASSDHIAQHVSYGGVYCEDFSREGIIAGFKARRTIAATDKIYLEFTCNDQPLGSTIVSSEAPQFSIKVDGTAKLKRITIVRNEEDWKVFDDLERNVFEGEVTDGDAIEGERRYYLRVEQEDGNMAWASPVWVTVSS